VLARPLTGGLGVPEHSKDQDVRLVRQSAGMPMEPVPYATALSLPANPLPQRIPTGLRSLDQLLGGGLAKGSVTVLARVDSSKMRA